MSKESHDQKRKAKLAKRAKKQAEGGGLVLPYTGKKYRADEWLPFVYHIETAVYETIELSGRTLTNDRVWAAFVSVIKGIRAGGPALLPEGEPAMTYEPGNEVEYLSWNIRRHWGILVEAMGPLSSEDLVGILRTLLFSIQAHAAHTGQHRGYVEFIEGFIDKGIVPIPLKRPSD